MCLCTGMLAPSKVDEEAMGKQFDLVEMLQTSS
jgi:hypothetical protein